MKQQSDDDDFDVDENEEALSDIMSAIYEDGLEEPLGEIIDDLEGHVSKMLKKGKTPNQILRSLRKKAKELEDEFEDVPDDDGGWGYDD